MVYIATYWVFDGAAIRAPQALVAFLGCILIWISVEDARTLTFPIWAIAALAVTAAVLAIQLDASIWHHCSAAVVYTLLFVGIDHVLRPEPETPALGLGDSLLIGCGALLLGPLQPIQTILVASIAGLLWTLFARLVFNRPWRAPLPFGLFLGFGIWLTFLEPQLIFRL